jgi:hypothetical protein
LIEGYEVTVSEAMMQKLIPEFDQPGDTVKGSQKIVDLLRGEWPVVGGGHKLPARVALGDDAYENIENVYAARLKENKEWEDWISKTSYD